MDYKSTKLIKNKFLIDFLQDNKCHAGSKAREDINRILESAGYISLNIERKEMNHSISNAMTTKLEDVWQVYKKMRNIPKHSVVIMQYPFFNNRTIFFTVKIMCVIKKSCFIVLVHDIDSIRLGKKNSIVLEECKVLQLSNYLIVHNHIMKETLQQYINSFDNKVYELNLFDYVISSNKIEKTKMSKKVIIAGNLSSEKSPYVYKINALNLKNVSIDLYGVNYTGTSQKLIQYRGVFSPDDIPFHEGFGLVWDGDRIDTCSGNTGEYTRINNPHKLSLYMAAGIPVIVWKESAIAKFVQENNVGFCVDSLYEIDELIGNVTEETYRELVKNVKPISERVRKGYYTLNVLDKIISDMIKKHI